MSIVECPGPVRLFAVEPDSTSRRVYRVIGHDARQIASTVDLAAAVVIAATSSARSGHRVWVSSPDLWACAITHTTDGFLTEPEVTQIASPLDAIGRVLALITIPTTTGDNP
jgi:hypothetical protein